ncbi:TlyA family RNA methyltransferase [Sneathiella sp.]|uniref:TlyA family RNA methyltransferase n=1 Tax=Sneathiella sp. TaxID=1964365 RepID=UPI00356492E0
MDTTLPSQRLDLELVRRKLVKSRARAQSLIAGGQVSVGGSVTIKTTRQVTALTDIELSDQTDSWVGRGAHKLLAALDHFGIDPRDRIAADIGASTGGFTQVLLRRGAKKIYAVDVGHSQINAEIARDPRVVNLEKTNARDLTAAHIPEPLGIIVADVSFISLKLALPAALSLAANGAVLIALVKPQFEVGKGNVGKGGIVRDPDLVATVPVDLEGWINTHSGWRSLGIIDSPIEGSDGNHEFLLGACYDG